MGESFNGIPLTDERNEFLEQTRQAREKRATDQKKNEAALVIQRFLHTVVAKRKFKDKAMERFQTLMEGFNPEENQFVNSGDVFQTSNLVMKIWGRRLTPDALEKLCRYIVWSMSQSNACHSYIGCGMTKDATLPWIRHLKLISVYCLESMTKLKPELVSDSKLLSLFLTTLVSLTSLDKWTILQNPQYSGLAPGMNRLNSTIYSHMLDNEVFFNSMHSVLEAGLARPGKYFLKKANLLAIAKLINRTIMKDTNTINMDCVIQYIYKILTVPAYIYHVQSICPEALDLSWLWIVVSKISDGRSVPRREAFCPVSLLGNLVQLGQCSEKLAKNFFLQGYVVAISRLLDACVMRTECTKKSHWHPILGWVGQAVPSSLLNCINAVKTQIEYLWGPVYLAAIFHPLNELLRELKVEVIVDNKNSPEASKDSPTPQKSGGLFKNAFVRVVRKALMMEPPAGAVSLPTVKFNSGITAKVSESCELFCQILNTFSICRLDILTGLCFKQSSRWLVAQWRFLQLLGKDVRCWVEILLCVPRPVQEYFVIMFADAMVHFVTMLDDQEMYEDQQAFSLTDMTKISEFTNQLCYRIITHPNAIRLREYTWNSLKTLLIVLYRRDCRRKFCPDDHWLMEPSKLAQLIFEIEKGRKNAKRVLIDMPHVLREETRVLLFRKWAASEKTLNGNSPGEHDFGASISGSTLVTIQRGRIVEDGYAQLACLSPKALKGTIRVRFQNELGLDEAGIDQDGVFKEFLEETINAVFNPSLNLFKTTNENLLYPSSLSYLHENHLQLFEFVGKMLAKAIYEGIVVDVHFATFFLSQILGYQQNALFSAIDELQSLDREIYSSLNYIKHYKGNVEDLDLTFSVDQDCVGEIKTTELTPGGRLIPVTNQNKISYLYLMAHFHLYVQIKDQTVAFLKGFRSIIPNEWIRIFSPPELQRLISGEDTDIDLNDLRRNTQYYGGFHDNHRVVVWLWEILENDFQETERRQFLKFVTSCSKPPLLGFANLDPPFSIRCVEVSDDEDTGDTIGSVLRGFLTIGKKSPAGRLPTSSTCFNLLKLPNYQKKPTLRDKLRYAVTSNVGFELS